MDIFDINFYSLFYKDLQGKNLKEHYLKHGKKEKRLININQFIDFLINIKFDSDFYIKFRDLKLSNNKYRTLYSFLEYDKYKDFKTENELSNYLQKNIDLNFVKKFYNLNDNIQIYKLSKNTDFFNNEIQMDNYLKSIDFDIDFYKNFYKLKEEGLELKKHYIFIGKKNKYFYNKINHKLFFLNNSSIKNELNILLKKEQKINSKNEEFILKEKKLLEELKSKSEITLNEKKLLEELKSKEDKLTLKEKNLIIKEQILMNELDKEKYKLKLDFEKKEFILKKKILNIPNNEINDFLSYENIFSDFFFCLKSEQTEYCEKYFNILIDINNKYKKDSFLKLDNIYIEKIYKKKKKYY